MFFFEIGSGWNYGGGYAHTPVKVVKYVAPSHGWSSGWSGGYKPSYSAGNLNSMQKTNEHTIFSAIYQKRKLFVKR